MKNSILLVLPLLFSGLCRLDAQTAQTRIDNVPDQVTNYFQTQISKDAPVKWSRAEDERDVYIFGDYEIEGDKKQIIFRNNAFYCNRTEIPLEYCPAKIKYTCDTMGADYKLVKLYYQRAASQNTYFATFQKGKKKKVVVRDMVFSTKGEFQKETDPEKVLRGF